MDVRRRGWRIEEGRGDNRSGRGKRGRIGCEAELVVGVSEEANSAAAVSPVFTEVGSVARRVEPALEHAMRELTRVTPLAVPLPVIRACRGGVEELAGVPAASLLGGVGVGTLGPVVGPATWTGEDLEVEHPEMIGGEGDGVGRIGRERGDRSSVCGGGVPEGYLNIGCHVFEIWILSVCLGWVSVSKIYK